MPHEIIRPGHRAVRVVIGLAALAALAALLVAVPFVLLVAWQYLGPPLPTPQELIRPDDGALFVRVLCSVGWLAWATFVWSLSAELLGAWRGWRLPAVTWQRRIAAGLIAAVTMAIASPAIASATAAPVRAAPLAPATTASALIGVPSPSAPSTASPPARPNYVEHQVRPGEQMPALAEKYLGDKYRWHAIAAATYGLPQPEGKVLRPGDTRIYPGWTVRIPIMSTPVTQMERPVYRVEPGDWLSGIAARFLGDSHRYPEIAALNPHLEQRDHRFPDHIEPTWRIILPADVHDRGSRPHATGTLVRSAPPATETTPASPPDTGGASPGTAPTAAPTASGPSASPSPSVSPSATPSPSNQPSASLTPSASTTPARAPTAGPATVDEHQPAEDGSLLDKAVLIGVPLFSAGLLAALLLTTLRRARRRQEQHRPVGRRVPTPIQPKAETQLRVVAQPVAVERLDHALRVLGAGLADRQPDQMPDIVGAWLNGDTINLLLTQPCPDPPRPWTGDQLTWTLPGDIPLPDAEGQLAPLPTLAAVGSQPGLHLLLDLERLGLLAITGDHRRAEDLVRYLTAELATNAWSDHAEITVAGFDAGETGELIALGGDRITAAASVSAAVERIRRRASQVVQSLDHLNASDPLTGRVADIAADAWMPHVLLAKDPGADEIAAIEALDRDLSATGRCAIAVVATTTDHIGRWPISVDADGRLAIPFLGMTDEASISAAGLPRTELRSLAELLDTARRHTPQPSRHGASRAETETEWPPVPAAEEVEPWAAGTDAAGALLTEPATETAESETGDQFDPTDDEAPYEFDATAGAGLAPMHARPAVPVETSGTATVDEAVRVSMVMPLAGSQARTRKRTTAPVRRRHTDPTLDADVRAWNDADPTRPRISILGPVTVEAPGQPPSERLRFYAEILVYLSARGARGATVDQFDEALWPNQTIKATSRRVAVARARRWLGETTDAQPWLPDATADRRYRLRDGYLLDWHLFRRLRSRGESRGPAGTGDLRQALALVRGAPLAGADIAYSPAARNPYPWLPTSEVQPHHLASAVVDTAHRLVELCLDGGDLVGARWAVDQAWLTDPDRGSDIVWRDLFRVAAAEGSSAELDRLLGELIRVREAEVPEDLDRETYRLLCELMPDRIRAGAR